MRNSVDSRRNAVNQRIYIAQQQGQVCWLGLTQFFYESVYITHRWRGLKPRQRRGYVSPIGLDFGCGTDKQLACLPRYKQKYQQR